jgi:hypothetical protein
MVISYETLKWLAQNDTLYKNLIRKTTLLILDEVHRIKNIYTTLYLVSPLKHLSDNDSFVGLCDYRTIYLGLIPSLGPDKTYSFAGLENRHRSILTPRLFERQTQYEVFRAHSR